MEIRAEMVGNVAAVVAPPGTPVAAGDMVVLLESMKMEIPVLAEFGGVVSEVRVAVGDVVQEGDVLALIAPDSSNSADRPTLQV